MKYTKYKTFEIIIPNWIVEDILNYKPVKIKFLKIIKKTYNNLIIKTKSDTIDFYSNNEKKTLIKRKSRKTKRTKRTKRRILNKTLIVRGDILPQPREKFIGL